MPIVTWKSSGSFPQEVRGGAGAPGHPWAALLLAHMSTAPPPEPDRRSRAWCWASSSSAPPVTAGFLREKPKGPREPASPCQSLPSPAAPLLCSPPRCTLPSAPGPCRGHSPHRPSSGPRLQLGRLFLCAFTQLTSFRFCSDFSSSERPFLITLFKQHQPSPAHTPLILRYLLCPFSLFLQLLSVLNIL